MGEVNQDLQREREKCTFNIEELTAFIDGGPHKTQQRKEREEFMLSRQDLLADVPLDYMSHKEKYEEAVRKSVILYGMVHRWQAAGNISINNYIDVLENIVGATITRDGSPLGIHYLMFIPSIFGQGTEEQQAKWLPRASVCNIIGTYAQTELGHGTFIRGLETTATYDAATQEFVLHSPTLTSYKWWPGGLGQTANYCVLIAQLYTKNQCYGVHPFMVQIRDEETHEPLPGIKVGEVGAKLGLNGMNNGFLGFDHVRIPRTHMLMKHAQVLEDGTYVKLRDSKLTYGTMVLARVVVATATIDYISKAVTIATRYSAVRRQCQMKAGEPEIQILDYVTQQHKIFIGIAAIHALRITSKKLWSTFLMFNDDLARGELTRLAELHALASCLKAVCTADGAMYIEKCRLACGGHGYLLSSNLPLTYGHVTAACTYEGENTVLLLQTARFLMKTWQQIESVTLTPTVMYLKEASSEGFCNKWENSVEGIIRGFKVLATRKIAACVDSMQSRIASGVSFEDAWNLTSVQLVSAAEMHCRMIIISTFYEEMVKLNNTVSPELKTVLNQLVELYSLYWALDKLSDLLLYTPISQQDVTALQAQYENVLHSIRPNAVGLVDAFDIRDDILQSTLGAYDGRVYERIMEEAKKSPLNKETVNQSFHKYLKPFMQGKL